MKTNFSRALSILAISTFLFAPVTPVFAEVLESSTDESMLPSYPESYLPESEPTVVEDAPPLLNSQPEITVIPESTSEVPAPSNLTDLSGKQTFTLIQVGQEYVYSKNANVKITFTNLPAGDHYLTIKEVSVNVEGVVTTGYEFDTDMQNGSFKYVLSLPNPYGNQAEVKFSEDNTAFQDVNANIGSQTVSFSGDHFTVFVVTYNSIPVVYPGSFTSLGYAATSTKEFGDLIQLSGAFRKLNTIELSLTNWACENDFSWNGANWVANRTSTQACITTPGSSYTHPITLNIYNVDNSSGTNQVGTLITTKTITATIPFRPSWDSVNCPAPTADIPFGGTWYDPVQSSCVHGYAFNLNYDFSLDNLTLPDQVVVTIAYNTSVHGFAPIGNPGPYDSLNVSLATNSPTTGTNVEPDVVFWNTTFGGFYTDGGAGGVGILRRDTNWAPYTLATKLTMFGNEAPVVTITTPTPLENTYVKGTITGRALATDDYGMGSYYLRFWKDGFDIAGGGTLVGNCGMALGADLLGTSLDKTCTYNTTTNPDGLYIFSAQFLDSHIAWGQALRQFYVDNTKPVVTLTSPTGNVISSLSTDFIIDATDNFALDKIVGNIYKAGVLYRSTSVSIAGLPAGTHTIDLATVMPGSVPLPEGAYTLKYNAQDKAGNISTTKTFDFTVDNTNPTLTVKGTSWGNSYTPASIGIGSLFKVVSFKLFDLNKVDKVTINGVLKDLSNNQWSDVNNVKPGVFGAIEGLNTIVLFDVAGNTTTYQFTLDTTAPSVPINGLPDATYLNTNNFYFSWDASSDSNPGPITYIFQASLSPSQVGGVLNSGVWVNTSSSNPQQNPLLLPQILSVGAPDGTWYWQVKAVDQLGNESNWSEIWDVTLDTVSPTGIVNYSTTAPTNTDVIATLTVSEPVTITNNGGLNTFTFNANGTFTFNFQDLAGNTGSAIATVNNIDKVAPLFAMQDVTLDEGSAIPNLEDFVSSNPESLTLVCTPASLTLADMQVTSPATTKITTIDCTVTDLAGNVSSAQADLIVNNVLPSVSITANPSTSVLAGTPVLLTANVAGNVLAGNAISSYLWSGNCSGTLATFNLNTPTPSSYNCSVLVTDVDGDTATANITVSAANQLPSVVVIASPSANVSAGTVVTLQGNVLSGDANFSYVWSGACSGSGTITSTGLTGTTTVPSTVGNYYCRIDVTDNNGDVASAGVVVAVNNGQVLGIGAAGPSEESNANTQVEEESEVQGQQDSNTETDDNTPNNSNQDNPTGEILGASTDSNSNQNIFGIFSPLACFVLLAALGLIAAYFAFFRKKSD